jgi:hypothetical protein
LSDLTEQQSSLSVKITGSDVTGMETLYVDATANGLKVDGSAVIQPVSLDKVYGINFTLGRKTSALALPIISSKEQSYSATKSGVIIANAASDFFYITGSATKVVRILRISLSGTQTTSGVRDFILIKRSTNSTGGTPTTIVATSYDSSFNNPTAIVTYNTGFVTVGTTVGSIASKKYFIGTTTIATPISELVFESSADMSPITLRGANEMLSLNFNAQTATGNSLDLNIEWTEE